MNQIEIIKYNLPSNFLFYLSSTPTYPHRKCRYEENKSWMILPPPPSASLLELSSCHSVDLSNLTLPFLPLNLF